MSILVKPYEISAWDDTWDSAADNGKGKFVEKRLGIIGSNEMTYQGRVIEPTLTRNVNGIKRLSFKMYKHFVDSVTGEKVNNPFSDWLISERKVKLKYGKDENDNDIWYDFIIKDIAENSSNYLYTYQLEDALVQELSKNGFNVTLDQELMNNMDTAEGLAAKVLEDTNWTVNSEAIVERVEEGLVYLKTTKDLVVTQILDDYPEIIEDGKVINFSTNGIKEKENVTLPSGAEILGFYSSCTNKPHRFQFIYLEGEDAYNDSIIDENRIIKIANCQYYIDIAQPSHETDGYQQSATYKQFYLPSGVSVFEKGLVSDTSLSDTTISYKYRGKRYGFAQKTKYIPLLERYCQEYTKSGKKYYGYLETKYDSPVFLQNVITNTEFKGTSGWTGTYTGSTPNAKATFGIEVESVYGRFNNGHFSSVVDELSNGTYNADNTYTSYLKITCPARGPADYGILINSGFYDNRTQIGSVENDEEWVLTHKIVDASNQELNTFDFQLREVSFDTTKGSYTLGTEWAEIENGVVTFGDNGNTTPEIFKKKKIKLVIIPPASTIKQIYYIEDIQLYKKILNDKNEVIRPGETGIDGVTTKDYKLFPAAYVENIDDATIEKVSKADDIEYDTINEKDFNYSIYAPVYNEGAQKVRSVTAKESNYFNILQSIAETFEAWLELEITREVNGGIQTKTAKFKNYSGGDNYAAFRYGVNLKDIQRTYGSKNIVTKLVVKQNSNELAKNGFCTIARAGSNTTGENYIYDFQYFFKTGMLREDDYVASLYYADNPYTYDAESKTYAVSEEGPDVCGEEGHGTEGHECKEYNIQNYFNRIKNINTRMINITDKVIPLQQELTQYKADLAVQEGLRDAAADGIEQVREDFHTLTGLTPETISESDFTEIQCVIPSANDTNGVNNINYADWAKDASVTATREGGENSTKWKFDISLSGSTEKDYEVFPFENASCEDVKHFDYDLGLSYDRKITVTDRNEYDGIGISANYIQNKKYILQYHIIPANDSSTIVTIGGHDIPFIDKKLTIQTFSEGGWQTIAEGAADSYTVNVKNRKVLSVTQEGRYNFSTVSDTDDIGTNCFFIQPNRGIKQGGTYLIGGVKLYEYGEEATSSYERTIYIQPKFTLTTLTNSTITRDPKIACTIPAYSNNGSVDYSLAIVDTTASNISNLLTEYATYTAQYNSATDKIGYKNSDDEWEMEGLEKDIEDKEAEIKQYEKQFEQQKQHKLALNKLFFAKYSRFIQEGTWISEEYIDDDKYYADALSVMYDSCYPQVAYSINVLALSALPGYEGFDFNVGEKTYAEDSEFFGENAREEVIIAEMSEALDDPSKNTIKVQNFKNQFQDLFQKITATVQQTQYNTGSYDKAVALAEANAKIKGQFLSEAISSAEAKLSAAGQTTVVQDVNGITLTDERTKDQMRLIGGAILMSVEDKETGERKWKTGLTPEGISASLVTAGTINTGNISIMNGKDATFMWNTFGLSAFDTDWTNGEITGTPKKDTFVRFDKYGIYGIKPIGANGVDGTTWKPTSAQEIDDKATFALTWEGLKVTGESNTIARIGKLGNNIVNITQNGSSIFCVRTDGTSEIAGWYITPSALYKESISNGSGFIVHLQSPTTLDTDTPETRGQASNRVLTVGVGSKDENGLYEDYPFYLTSGGFLHTKKLYATGGEIGSWKLDTNSLYSQHDATRDGQDYRFSTYLFGGSSYWHNSNPSSGRAADVFVIKEQKLSNGNPIENTDIYPFYLWRDGTFGATKANITGTIYADNGRIGGFQITPSSVTTPSTLTWSTTVQDTLDNEENQGYDFKAIQLLSGESSKAYTNLTVQPRYLKFASGSPKNSRAATVNTEGIYFTVTDSESSYIEGQGIRWSIPGQYDTKHSVIRRGDSITYTPYKDNITSIQDSIQLTGIFRLSDNGTLLIHIDDGWYDIRSLLAKLV